MNKKVMLIISAIVLAGVLYAPFATAQWAGTGSGNMILKDGKLTPVGDKPINATGGVALTAPSVKGHPDTLSLRNASDVPTVLFAPSTVTADLYVPTVPIYAARTSNYTIPATEATNHVFTNEGASGSVTLTLPTAAIGMLVRVLVVASQTITVTPQSTDTIMIISDGDAGDEIAANTAGNFVWLLCGEANKWYPIANSGFANVD